MRLIKRTYAIIYSALIALLAVSTLTPGADYGSIWFTGMWGLLAFGLIVLIIKTKLWRRPALLILHASLPVILAGGALTWLTARQSVITLQPGVAQSEFGLTIELERFETDYYPGGIIPQNYRSHLKINGREMQLEVNRPLSVMGCRIYQQSFGSDGSSVVSLRKDAAGTAVTFTGYALFLLGGLLCLIPGRAKALAIIGLAAAGAQASVPAVTPQAADSLARELVVYQGRVCTFSTVARDVMLKVYGRTSYKGLSAERTVLSLTLFPDEWNSQPVIRHGSGHVSLHDCFDSAGRYTMASDPKTDERVGIILLLRNGRLFSRPGPDDELLSPARIEAEILFNKIPATLIIFITFFISAAMALWRPKWGRRLGATAFIMQTALLCIECWLTGHGPFASMFETLQLLAAATALLSLTVSGALPIGLLACGCMTLVAHLQASNPVVTPLMPVLHSPWLSLHVSLVMLSYALFVIIACMALGALIRRKSEAAAQCRRMLRPAVFLLGLGIFSGAVWANEAWGRYWGWDPKETWALITFMLYAVPLHLRRPSLWWYILPLLSVAMTYFGVNLLPSLHAYS